MRAAEDAIRRSIGRVSVMPKPTAGPLIAALTGVFMSKIRTVTVPPPSRCSSARLYALRAAGRRGAGAAGRGATIRFARCRPSRGWGPAGRGATIRFARCRPSRGWGPAGRGATIVERRSAGTEVGAGAERAAGPGHDDRAHAIVGGRALPRLAERAHRRRGA